MATTNDHVRQTEITILARILGNDHDQLPKELAGYILGLGFNGQDKSRMHDLAVRNQHDALTPEEKEEMFAFAKAGDLLSILKSKARRTLGVKLKTHTVS